VPRAAILDPTYTFSVSPFQTAAGTADIISHILETYFQAIPGGYLQKRMCEGLLKTCFRFGPDAVAHGDDYEARANLMWAASWAINGFLKCGYAGPWAVHPIEHQLSAYYDVTHGAGLAVLTPHWFRMILSKHPASLDLFYDYGTQVWELDRALGKAEIARRSIEKTERFFTDLGLPATLRGLGIDSDDKFEIMAEKSVQEGSEKPASRWASRISSRFFAPAGDEAALCHLSPEHISSGPGPTSGHAFRGLFTAVSISTSEAAPAAQAVCSSASRPKYCKIAPLSRPPTPLPMPTLHRPTSD
jgi:alcohol dehydrogenase class IV